MSDEWENEPLPKDPEERFQWSDKIVLAAMAEINRCSIEVLKLEPQYKKARGKNRANLKVRLEHLVHRIERCNKRIGAMNEMLGIEEPQTTASSRASP